MALRTFDADQPGPAPILGRKVHAHDQPGARTGILAPGDLWCERQKLLIQAALGQKVAQQVRSSLRQNDLAPARVIDCFQNATRADMVAAGYGCDLYR